jgi:dynein light intermediate chain
VDLKKPIGLLLLRVRDDFKMTIAAYQSLYESSVLFGINKQVQAEEGKADLEQKIEDLEKQKQILLNKVLP